MNRAVIQVTVSLSFLSLLIFALTLDAQGLNPEQFGRMVKADLEKTGRSADSVMTPLRVTAFADGTKDFMLAPVVRSGKLVTVYRDDPKRNSVTVVATEPVLKSTRLSLFSKEGAKRFLQEKGMGGSDPLIVSFGPMSLFGALGAGWFVPTAESFLLLSFEGRVVTESEVARYWGDRLPAMRQLRERLLRKE